MPVLNATLDAAGAEGFQPLLLDTDQGAVVGRFYPASGGANGGAAGEAAGEADATQAAVLWVGGVGGGFDTPARGLYPRLCADLTEQGIASLRLRFRNPRALADAVHDVLCGLEFLERRGIRRVGLVGHSFGGAVVIQAGAAALRTVRSVATLATQDFGTEPVTELACPLLLIHGEADAILPPACSLRVHRMAREPKKLVLVPGSGHALDETSESVCRELRDWLRATLHG